MERQNCYFTLYLLQVIMMKNQILVAPSLLSADFTRIHDAVKLAEQSGSDFIHLDVMDGVFVPNITFGPKMVRDIRKITKLPLDVHLMITRPEHYIEDFAAAGADFITIHGEATIHVHRVLSVIKSLGKKAGISLIPSTPVSAIEEVLPLLDIILIMTVNPGFGGQKLIPETLQKVKTLSELKNARDLNYLISVDGGINRDTAEMVRAAGADLLISGSAFFESSEPSAEVLFLKGNKVV